MNDQPPKSGNFQDYEFPKTWKGKDRDDFVNGMLADSSSVATVELFIDPDDDELVARVWFAKA